MSNLGIIPARGGSKGLPRKNVKSIAGKPLIAWTIEAAFKSKSIDRVLVSTDDEETAQIARDYGAEVPFLRPKELATDLATTESAMLHALNFLQNDNSYIPKTIALLQCTSPVRNSFSIDNAFKRYFEAEADTLVSVTEDWHFLWSNECIPLYNYKSRPRRQDILNEELKFRENGSIYISNVDRFLIEKNRIFGKIALYIMEEKESFEIDSTMDWVVVEAILKSGLHK